MSSGSSDGDGPDQQRDGEAVSSGPNTDEFERRRLDIARRKGRAKAAKTGGIVVLAIVSGVVVLWGGLSFLLSGEEKVTAGASVGQAPNVYQPPGAPNLPPATKNAYRDANEQSFRRAERAGDTHVGYPVYEPAPPPEPPKPVQVPTPVQLPQPVQAPKAAEVVDAQYEADLKAAIKAAYVKMDAAMADKPPGMVASSAGSNGGRGGYQLVTQADNPVATGVPSAPLSGRAFDGPAAPAGSAAAFSGRSGTGAVLAMPHQAYGVTQVAADSDAPQEVAVEILGGPFVGGVVHGQPTFKQKSASVAIDRLVWNGGEYSVKGFLINQDTMSPSLDVEVDNHYAERIILPAIAGALGVAGKVMSQPVTTLTQYGAGFGAGTVMTQTEPSTGRQIAGGALDGGASTAAGVLKQEAGEIRPTVRVAAQQAVVIQFTSVVRTGDVRR